MKIAAAPAPAPAPIAKAEPAKKVRAKKAEAEKKAIAKAAETPTHSDEEEAPVAVKSTRKGRFEKGSEEAREYMRSLREKAAAKKSAKNA